MAIGECTPIGTGRYVDVMVEVARRSNVRIVAATGFFHESWAPMHPIARALDLDALTDLLVREITEGMGSTTVRAGLIKCATGSGRISPLEEKVLRSIAHEEVGQFTSRSHAALEDRRQELQGFTEQVVRDLEGSAAQIAGHFQAQMSSQRLLT